jgi:hypothetical protein
MNNKLLSCLVAGALGATLALAPPAFAHGGGGWHGGGGGWHGGGGGWHGGGMRFSGARFGGAHFAHAGFSPRFAFHHRFFHHRFHRFAFFGAPFAYASYDGCWRRAWTSYGPQWVNFCGNYGY